MVAFGHEEREARNLLIFGGGNIGMFLAKELEQNHDWVRAKIIEHNKERAEAIESAQRPSGGGRDRDRAPIRSSHLVHVQRRVRPVSQEPVPVHERDRVPVRGLVVVQDVVRDRRVRAEVRDERHLRDARDVRLGLERLLRVLVPALLEVAQDDAIERVGFVLSGVRHGDRVPERRLAPRNGARGGSCTGIYLPAFQVIAGRSIL